MNKRKFPVTNIGSVSLLMIFIVLCLPLPAAIGLHRHLPVTQPLITGHPTKQRKSLQRQRRSCRHAIIPLPMQTAIINRCVNSLESPAATDPWSILFRQLSTSHRNWKSGSRSPIRTVPLQPGLTGKIQILLLHSIRSPVGKWLLQVTGMPTIPFN